jgi:CBS domain-containing protein
MAAGERGLGRLESVVAFVAGAVIGSEVARRSGRRTRSALEDLRWRADRLRDRAEGLVDRLDAEGVRALTPRLGSAVRDGGDAIRDRVDAARERADAVRSRALELRRGASRALDRADVALDRLDDAFGRLRRDVRRRRARSWRPVVRAPSRPVGTEAPTVAAPAPSPTVASAIHPVVGTVDVDDPLADAAKRLLDSADAYLVALDGDRIAGILTPRHLLSAVAARLDPTTAAISDVMTPTPLSIPPTATLEEAAVLVKYLHVDELVIAEGGEPLGVLRAVDLPS